MGDSYRRYEILLPLQGNDGTALPREAFAQTLKDLIDRFGAVSPETQVIKGQWRRHQEIQSEQLIRVFVDVEDVAENRAFFVKLKEDLKVRFQQVDIWITHHPIEVL
jgi:hypothetical protein